MIEDGEYDVMIIDAREDDAGAVHLDVAIASGSHRGETLTIVAKNFHRDPLDLLALPATLTVVEGRPRIRMD